MTTKDFELIASVFWDHDVEPANAPIEEREFVRGLAQMRFRLAYAMADALAGDNSRFNKNLFLEACGCA